MKGKSKFVIYGILSLISLNSFSQDKTEELSFKVSGKGLETKISSESLELTSRFCKPASVPQTSDLSTWKMISDVSSFKNLGGINGQMTSVSWAANTGQVDCETWISDNNKLVAFRQTFTNRTKKSVKLNALYPLFVDGKSSFRFGEITNWLIMEQFRHKNDLPGSEAPAAGRSVSCDPFFIINDNRGEGNNLFIGYQTFNLHLAEIDISFDKELQVENITAKCDFEGAEVPPDGSRTSQWVIVSQGSDANLLIDEYTGRIRSFYNIDEPPKNAPTVYCTWYYHADNYNEEIFKGDIEQFKREHLPFDVFLIDECWDVGDWGDFEANSSFPDGMKWAAGQINSAGYTAGIWCAPFLVDGESDLSKDHSSWLLRNSKGKLCTFNMNERDHFILDLTYPGVCDYLEDQFRKISRDWGYEYFKFDFMRSVFIDSDQQFYDKTATSLEAYRKGLEAIRRGTGNDAYISVCGGHYGASYGIANTQRSGSDVKSQWDEKELPKYRQNILRTWMTGLWHVDPDAMMVRTQEKPLQTDKRSLTTGLFTDDEAFTNTLNQFIGGNLITFTEDFETIGNDRKMLYKHVIPSVNSASRPLDPFNPICPEMMVTKISPVCQKLGSWNMLSIINWSNDTKDYNIILDQKFTENLKGDRFLVYDFQSGEIVNLLSGSGVLNINGVRGHQSKLLKIVPWDEKTPMFLGTDLNFSCGGLEIADITYYNNKIVGSLETGWSVPVKLTFVIPGFNGYETWKVETVPGQKRFFVSF
jgi:Melibiase